MFDHDVSRFAHGRDALAPFRTRLLVAVAHVALASVTAASVAAVATAQEGRPRNVLFILSDDQRHDQLSCAGHPIVETPHLDALAARGMRFRRAFVTTPICAASRASILTSLYERTHRTTFRTKAMAAEHFETSYPLVLHRAGYRTGFVGKFGVNAPVDLRKESFDVFVPISTNPYFKKQPDGTKRHTSEIIGDHAVAFLREQDPKRPFCLSISFNAVHAEDGDKENHYPWPIAMDGRYEDVTIPPPAMSDPAIYDAHPDFLKTSLNRQRFFWRWDTPEKYDRNMRAYYRMLSGMDRVIGRVLDALRARGLEDDTLVIFCGDNGYYMGQRGFAGKWSHYDESLRVPLILADPRAPESARGTVNDAFALNIDIAATILDAAGVSVPERYQGRSLLEFVHGGSPKSWRHEFFCEHLMHYPPRKGTKDGGIPKWEGIRQERWSYARYFEQEPVYEYLHDLQNDPQQLRNLALEPEFAETLRRLRERCTERRDELGGAWSLEKFPLQR
ncbi:MAG: sulfatase [Planctomycetes bacterium]|nr:sulfatase [Planctomycetota bacterium]MCB9918783.1 sulfatase [Planctomycetota bacterium]